MSRVFDIVFEGGGARGIVLNGALEHLEAAGHRHRRIVGTSAGAIAASLVAAGFTGAELAAMSRERRPDGLPAFAEYVMEPAVPTEEEVRASGLYLALVHAERAMHIPQGMADRVAKHFVSALAPVPGISSVFSFIEEGGLHTGDGFVEWLRRTLDARRPGDSSITLGALHERTGTHLTIMATDTTAARMLVLNHFTAPGVPLVAAVRMSMSIPLFFEEVTWKTAWGTYLGEDITGHVVVDGGVLSNFPLRYILPEAASLVQAVMGPPETEPAMPLGLMIDATLEVPGAPPSGHNASSPVFARVGHTRLAQRVLNLVETMLDGNDDTLIQFHRDVICRLPAKGFFATEFHMEPARIEALLVSGRTAMAAHLAKLEKL